MPSPGPTPNQPPLDERIAAPCRPGRCRPTPGRGSGRCGRRRAEQSYRRRQRRRRRRPPRPTIQNQRHAGHEEHARPRYQHDSMVWPKSGCSDQQRDDGAKQHHGEEIAGHVGLALVLGEQPGADDDEGGLQEFRRLDRRRRAIDSQRCAPLTSTPTNSTATISTSMRPSMTSDSAADLRGRRGSETEHQRDQRRDSEDDLARRRNGSCRARCAPRPPGWRRRTARCQAPSATGTRPGTSGRPSTTSLRHGLLSRRLSINSAPSDGLHTLSIAFDSLPEGFAADLEILNWSKQAQAGDNSTTGSPRRRAPRRAPHAATAASSVPEIS